MRVIEQTDDKIELPGTGGGEKYKGFVRLK